MANQIGSLFVELNLNSAAFADGVNKANATTKSLGDNLKKFGEQSNYSMMEARHGVMLLGEEMGVHVPRAVSSMIASIGPVGNIFASAFPILGAVALAEVIAKVVEHFDKAAEKARQFAAEEQALQNKSNLTAQSLQLENLKLDDQIAKIRGGAAHNKLQEQLLEINKAAGALAESLDTQLSSSPMTIAAIAATLPLEWPSESQAEHLARVTKRVSILVDEGLAVPEKTAKGAPTGRYTLAP